MSVPTSKDDLITQVEASRAKLEAVLARIPESEQDRPDLPDGRSVKDIYAHLEFWTGRAIYLLDCGLRGETPISLQESDVDKINQKVFEDNHHRTVAEARKGERASFEQLMGMIRSTPEEVLLKPGYFPWAEGAAFEQWIRYNTYEHYDEHLPDLESFVARIGG